jgi:hypothetical protein
MTQRGLYNRSVYDLNAYNVVLDPGPNVFARRSIPREGMVDQPMVATTGVALNVRIPLEAGDSVAAVSCFIGATALGTPTHQFVAMYTPGDVLYGQSVDATSAAGAANSTKTFTFTTPLVANVGGIWSFSIVFAATTMPTLLGVTVAPTNATGEITIARTHGSGLLATAPGTVATPTNTNFAPYVELT